MACLSIEHGRSAYLSDFWAYAAIVLALALYLGRIAPPAHTLSLSAFVLAGLVGWSVLEYLLHRFVLHGLAPFKHWHAEHHARPSALLGVPTLASAAAIGGFFFIPVWLLGAPWAACALTLGLTTGYLGYSIVHHGMHHWRAQSGWWLRRKQWHALHHRPSGQQLGCFGVTTDVWDRLLGTARRPAATPATA
jgi:sterol desaturase/sphingolipid hydroxylase (fatty acid hydroxylase superfamily)